MQAILAMTFILVVFAIGDAVSVKTKSIISSLFVAAILFLIGFSIGVPQDLFASSTMLSIGAVIIPILLVHMGSMMNIAQLKAQWKTVIIALSSVLGIAFFILVFAKIFIGREAAIIAAPPVAGGVIAGIQMGEAAKSIGRNDLATFATLLVVAQGFVGYPIASFCLKKEGLRVIEEYRKNPDIKIVEEETKEESEKRKLIPKLPEKYLGDNLYLAKAAIVASIAVVISTSVKNALGFNLIDQNVLSLILGVVFAAIGFLEVGILSKANSYGLAIACLMTVIYSSLSKDTPSLLLNILPSLIIALLFGTIGVFVFSIIAGKFLKESKFMSVAIGISALFGFPGTLIISNEVASALAKNKEEKQFILSKIMPKMLVSGFITVSIASVVLAGILASTL